MVTVIHPSDSLHRAVNYNHQKEEQGKATCILAVNYPKDPADMNFYQKLHRLTNQAALRPRTRVNSVHISINFDPSEKLNRTTLQAIAQTYMEKIGFGKQPYLVYEHRDAGHPHLHVVTTNIRSDGTAINLHNIGKDRSEKARRQVEQEFDLVKADLKRQKQQERLQIVAIKKVLYGKSETKRAITNVLEAVLPKYKFTSLEELNAVLRQANVQATRGGSKSRTYQRGGLLYQVLGEQGKPIGVPIKASSMYNKPTLKMLEQKFQENIVDREPDKKRIRVAIDWYFLRAKQPSMEELKKVLGQESITVTAYKAKTGQTFGVTYVDHKTGAVFKGSDIGKEYTANGVNERIDKEGLQEAQEAPPKQRMPREETKKPHEQNTSAGEPQSYSRTVPADGRSALPGTDTNEEWTGGLPAELRQNRRKKKRKKRVRL